MQAELSVGAQKVRFDREATVSIYRETIVAPGPDQCSCISCKNFAVQRGNVYPKEFLHLLNELGADPRKEWEAFDHDFDMGNREHLYGGWFLFAGELIEGIDHRPPYGQESFLHWFTTSFPNVTLPTDIKICAVEFLVHIPWVLDENAKEHSDVE